MLQVLQTVSMRDLPMPDTKQFT